MEEKTSINKLRRKLGFWAALGGSVGLVVSGTAMVSVGSVAGFAGSAAWLPALIALIPMIAVACAYGELTAMFPGGGMIADYTMPALGKFWSIFAILSGYVLVIMFDGGNQVTVAGLTVESITNVNYLVFVVILLALILAINLFGVQFYGRIEVFLTIVMMVIYVIFGVLGFFGAGESMGVATPVNDITLFAPETSWGAALGCAGTAIWWYIGFEYVCPMAEENKSPHRNIPKALLIGLVIIFVADMLFIYSGVKYADLGALSESTAPQIEIAKAALGTAGNVIMITITILAAFTSVVAHFAALSRMLYGLAYKELAPQIFKYVHPKYRTPWVGIFFTLILIGSAVIYMAIKGADAALVLTLINIACTTYLLSYFIAVLDVLIYRKKYPDYPRLWKSPMGIPMMVIGLIGIVYCIWTMKSAWLVTGIAVIIFFIYIFCWMKYKKIPLTEKESIHALVKTIQERTEELPEWDVEVNKWMEQNKMA